MSPQSTKGTPPTGQTNQARYDMFSVGGGGSSGGGGAGSTQSLPRTTGKTSSPRSTNKYNTWASPAKASTSHQRSSSYSGGAAGGGQSSGGSSKNLASTSRKTGGSTRSLDRASTNTRVRIDEQGYARTYDASLTMRSDPGHITAAGEYGRQPLPAAMTENQSKFVQERVTSVEKHFGELCTDFAAYNRKLSKVRDRGDVLARAVMTYAEHETLNHTTKAALRDFAENFAAVQDYRESEVRKIEAKVVEPLTLYGTACKHAKERLKAAFSARDKEMKQKKNLDKVKTKAPSDRHQIAETNLQKASVDASMTSKALEKEIDGFEGKKLQDIKKILVDFVGIELMFHAKALEMYTNCYQGLSTMSEEDDLEEFRNSLRPPTAHSRLEMQRATSKSSLNASSVGRRTPSGTPQGVRRTTHQVPNGEGLSTMNTTGTRSMYSDTYQDDDDDDDDDEEDDYETEEDDEYDQQQHQHSQHRYQSQPHSQARR